MAGGGGVEWYFGYQFPHGDLNCEDWRSRNNLWEQTAHAINFFQDYLPYNEMKSMDDLISGGFCFGKENEVYAAYFPANSEKNMDLRNAKGEFTIHWYNPRTGGELLNGDKNSIEGGLNLTVGNPPGDLDRDWVCLIRKK
jgi:hypothetical protein